MRQNRTVLPGALWASLPLATLVALVALMTVPRPASSAPAAPQVGHPLVAVHGPHARLADDLGRQILLRGVNDNQLGEYYVDDPSNPSTIPLTAGDFERMAGFGFDVVRLIVSWSKLEPQPGVIDAGYIAAIKQAIEWARAADVYVIVDMHQDAWGPSIATPPGTTCTPPLSGNVGWDGAPAWATITDGASTCKLQVREIAPAVARAFTSFYGDRVAPDGVGIQTHLVRAWAALAAAVADDPAVAGYDLLNEPNPGELLGVAEVVALGAFYERAITAIRNAELSAPDGFAHPVLFEPVVYWSLLAVAPTPLPHSRPTRTSCSRRTCTRARSRWTRHSGSRTSSRSSRGSRTRPQWPRRTARRSSPASGDGSAIRSRRPDRWRSTPVRRTRAWQAARGGSGSRRAATPTR
jgi:endoglycosylceramidase